MTDIEIANSVKAKNIAVVAKKLGLKKSDLCLYGNYKAKIEKVPSGKKQGRLVLVTAISPTKSGNGKTTVSIGLADAFSLLHKKVCLALREPSLGPVFGMKGGATGGGYSQILPMEDINLHFNGDFHAITSANNLLASLIDNHIFQGNELDIDPDKIMFNRCLDCNDRALRHCTVSEGKNCTSRKESFVITAASEIMAIMCLATDISDLKERLGNITVALNRSKEPVFARDLKAQDAMAILLKDALKPNLVQTLINTPAIVHLGPFANIAHGCNSIIATKTALSLADYCITEAGFGADLGAEKFIDVKARLNNLDVNAVVLVATIKALKLNGGADEKCLSEENIDALKSGLCNLKRHIDAIKNVYKLNLVVTLNKFITDTEKEIDCVKTEIKKLGIDVIENEVWAKGGKGAISLAKKVIELCENKTEMNFAYNLEDDIKTKIEKIATKIYGAKSVKYSPLAEGAILFAEKNGFSNFPVIMAKTQYSFTDDPKVLGAPTNFELTVKNIEVRTGAGFLVVILGDMLLMPALGKNPAALNMKIDSDKNIEGIF